MRIDRDLLREGLGIFAMLFRKKKIKKILNRVAEALDAYDAVRDLDTRLDVAIAKGEGMTLSLDDVILLRRVKDKLEDILDR